MSSTRLPGTNPTAYLGIKEINPPELHFRDRAPTSADARPYDQGDIWIDETANEGYILAQKIGAVATWIGMAGVGALESLTGDVGGAVFGDAAENIDILGGGGLTVTGNPGTNTLTIAPSSGGNLIETLTGDVGGAVGPDGVGDLDILGGGGLTVTGNPGANTLTIAPSSGGNLIETLTGNAGGAVGPDGAGDLDIVGSGGITTTGNPGTNTITISPGGGGSIVETVTGDAGGAVGPDGVGNINIVGGIGTSTTGNPGANTVTIDAAGVDQQNIIYVGKHGNDANDGFTIDKAKLTFSSAITAAAAISPAAVVCLDNGSYSETITMQPDVNILAENATLIGGITGVDDSRVNFNTLSVNAANGIVKSAGTGNFIAEICIITATGGNNGVNCTSGTINLKSRVMTIENGFGVSNSTSDKVHLEIEDIFITGSGIGFGVQGGGLLTGEIQNIANQGAGAGTAILCLGGNLDVYINEIDTTTAINLNTGTTTVNLIGNSITATTAYTVNATSTLNVTINSISGTETVAAGGVANVYRNDVGIKTNQTFSIINPETTNTLYTLSNIGDAVYPQTGAITVNAGTTGQRPGAPVNGMIRYNSTTNLFEGYENGVWVNFGGGLPGKLVQQVQNTTAAVISTTNNIPLDDTIPQITEGAQLYTLAITPQNASNILVFDFSCTFTKSSNNSVGAFALFQDATANALFTSTTSSDLSSNLHLMSFRYYMTAGTTSSTTFQIRYGRSGAIVTTIAINSTTGGTRRYGGTLGANLTITEIQP